jgi:hypothetical protein
VIHSGRLWPYSQILDYAGNACQGQTLAYYKYSLITTVKFSKHLTTVNDEEKKVFFYLSSRSPRDIHNLSDSSVLCHRMSRAQCYKTFYGRKFTNFRNKLERICPKPLQSSLMFLGKARRIPYSRAPERCFTRVGSANIKLGWKGLPGTNTLAFNLNSKFRP